MSGWLPYDKVHGRSHTVSGKVLVWPRQAGAPGIPGREILVYLPPSLAEGRPSAGKTYPTLYFHDGQNVFDERTSYAGEWRADEALEELAREGIEAIAVAVPNSGEGRMDEYNPWPSREKFWRGGKRVGGKGDAYLDWLVGSVKPLVDRSFPTSHDRMETGIIGSSMGGLISMYGLLVHRQTFGLAGVISPSIRWKRYAIVRLIGQLGLPAARVHLDMGGREWRGGLDDARRLRDTLIEQGMTVGRDLSYVEERYAPHNEPAWARRLPGALRFLLAGAAASGSNRS
ncbi:MAG TPA: alpha/beta hydrolase-fold protein [Candidatus Limnocylindrales bacterium]|nr:alpha/beta hydrolase-fold protein [Candidatus Limnocylindrales bacterium]